MRRSLPLATTVLVLAFGAVGAHAFTPKDQTALVAPNQRAQTQQAQTADPFARSTEGRSAFTNDSGDQAPFVESHKVGRTSREDLASFMRNVFVLGITSLVFGLGAVGAKALWMSDDTESSPFGDRPPYVR